jgi:uroporphyrinogen-III synthase
MAVKFKALLITRPVESASAMAKKLQDTGKTIWISPLLRSEQIAHTPVVLNASEALIFTSAQAVRYMNIAKESDASPADVGVFVVGPQTAQAALHAGFTHIIQGTGGIDGLSESLQNAQTAYQSFLYVRGRHVHTDLTNKILNLHHRLVYDMIAASSFNSETYAAFSHNKISHVSIFSARTGRIFSDLVLQANFVNHITEMSVLCLSENVLGSVRHLPWAQTYTASEPNEAGMLDLLNRIA